jgi:hypothetical protein
VANELCLTGTLASTDFGRATDSLTSILAVTMKAAAKKSERISGSTKKEAIFGFLKSVYKDHPTTFTEKMVFPRRALRLQTKVDPSNSWTSRMHSIHSWFRK